MKVLLAGANSYIGAHLLPRLIEKGHTVICLMRSRQKLQKLYDHERVCCITGDLLREDTLNFPADIDAAYFLVNTMPSISPDFRQLETLTIQNLIQAVRKTNCRQLIYLTGIAGGAKPVFIPQLGIEDLIRGSGIPYTILRAAMIIGSKSAYFEIIQTLTARSPVILSSNWINTKCQPISIDDTISYLIEVLFNEPALNQTFDIGGPEILTLKKMIAAYAALKKQKRLFLTFPFTSPPMVASYWLKTITSIPYETARALIERMRYNMICSNNDIGAIIDHECLNYNETLKQAV